MPLAPPGFYGKIPARGDFLSCRVPAGLAARWDDWLAGLTVAVRAASGDAWPAAWLTAPLWHFALGAAVAPPVGAAGVLIASADRVGRMFPFTVIGASSGVPCEAWFAAAEALVFDSLEDGFDPALLDSALIELGPPAAGRSLDAGHTLWSCRGSDRVMPTTRQFAGLPDRAASVAMVMGEAADEAASVDFMSQIP